MLDAGRRTWEAVEAIEVAGGTSAGEACRRRQAREARSALVRIAIAAATLFALVLSCL